MRADTSSAIPHDRLSIGASAANPRPGAPLKAMGPQLATLKVLTLKSTDICTWRNPSRAVIERNVRGADNNADLD
jgi:hypothetical protein